MPPVLSSELDFYNSRGNCAYFVQKNGGFGCRHPRRAIEYCSKLTDCPMTQKQWNELVLKKPVEFVPYKDLI